MYNKKNISILFLIIGIIMVFCTILHGINIKDHHYSNELNDTVYTNNSNWGLANISYSITAAVSFLCSYLFFKIEDKS